MRCFAIIVIHALLMGGILYSCKKKTTATINLGYDYFPLENGSYVIYRLDSLYYNDFTGGIDTFRFEVKEKVVETFTDAAGQSTARIERYYRKSPSENWEIQDVWTANLNPNSAEKTEENQRFVKLSFPAKKNMVWDGNRFNALGRQDYKIESAGQALNLASVSFDSTLLVRQKADSNLIRLEVAYEVFAQKIGLVYKKFVYLEDRDSIVDYTKPLRSRVDYGFDYTYTYLTHGKE
jgi:hypothetical protein